MTVFNHPVCRDLFAGADNNEITDEDFRKTFDWCVTSAFIMSQLAVPHMLTLGRGSIVNISSGSGHLGIRALGAY